jgi:hypothetical protein
MKSSSPVVSDMTNFEVLLWMEKTRCMLMAPWMDWAGWSSEHLQRTRWTSKFHQNRLSLWVYPIVGENNGASPILNLYSHTVAAVRFPFRASVFFAWHSLSWWTFFSESRTKGTFFPWNLLMCWWWWHRERRSSAHQDRCLSDLFFCSQKGNF